MTSFTLTRKALADLAGIGRYTQETWGVAQRNTYLTMLDGCFRQLTENPHIGTDCSDIRKGYRKHKAGKHLIFYRATTAKKIEIVRVLHGRMDIDRKLFEN